MKAPQKALARQIILDLLKAAKTQSMVEIYERVSPGEDGRIRTSLSPVATITGRFGSSATFLEASTNLQNIPKKTAKLNLLYDVRSVMVPDPGCILLEGDLSQAESRVVAVYAEDERTLELFASGADVHRITASRIFNCKPEDVTDNQRFLGKTARHAIERCMGWRLFLEKVNGAADLTGITISVAEAKAIHENYHRQNPLLKRWWGRVEDEVKHNGFLVNAFGRKLILIDKNDITSAISFLPQGDVADHLNTCLRYVFEVLDPKPLQVLLQMHDAIFGQTEPANWLVTAKALKKAMEVPLRIKYTDLLIPADISASSTSWGEMRKVVAL